MPTFRALSKGSKRQFTTIVIVLVYVYVHLQKQRVLRAQEPRIWALRPFIPYSLAPFDMDSWTDESFVAHFR